MRKALKHLAALFFPMAIVGFIYSAFLFFYFGPALNWIFNSIFFAGVLFVCFLLTALLLREKSTKIKFIYSSLVALIPAGILLAIFLYESRPTAIKNLILLDTIENNYTAVKGRTLYIGGESEDYLMLSTKPEHISAFLDSMKLEPSTSDIYKNEIGWFPKTKEGFTFYERNQFNKEIMEHVLINKDSTIIYYLRLFW